MGGGPLGGGAVGGEGRQLGGGDEEATFEPLPRSVGLPTGGDSEKFWGRRGKVWFKVRGKGLGSDFFLWLRVSGFKEATRFGVGEGGEAGVKRWCKVGRVQEERGGDQGVFCGRGLPAPGSRVPWRKHPPYASAEGVLGAVTCHKKGSSAKEEGEGYVLGGKLAGL